MGSERTDRSRALVAVTAAVALFCVLLIFLAQQLRAGRDPAIGAGKQTAAVAAPRPVVVRRVIITRVVDAPARSSQSSAPAAPAAAAPAPAPALAPAPVVSRGS
jgi:hypothetical protein